MTVKNEEGRTESEKGRTMGVLAGLWTSGLHFGAGGLGVGAILGRLPQAEDPCQELVHHGGLQAIHLLLAPPLARYQPGRLRYASACATQGPSSKD